MRKLILLAICMFSAHALLAAKWIPPKEREPKVATVKEPTIRVLIAKEVNAALLEVKGEYFVMREDTGEVLSSGVTGKRFPVQSISEGLRWGEEYPDVYQIKVMARKPATMMYVNGLQYRGNMSIYYGRGKGITIVNEVPIEDFLKSTLTQSFDNPPTGEALASLVIAERTALHVRALKKQSGKAPWDITASEMKYFGHGFTKQNGIEQAVENTKYIVLVKEDVPVQNVVLSREHAEELALSGCDAMKILNNVCPGSTLKTAVDPKMVR